MSDTDRCSREELDRVIEWLLEVQNEPREKLKDEDAAYDQIMWFYKVYAYKIPDYIYTDDFLTAWNEYIDKYPARTKVMFAWLLDCASPHFTTLEPGDPMLQEYIQTGHVESCPHCGGQDIQAYGYAFKTKGSVLFICPHCGAIGRHHGLKLIHQHADPKVIRIWPDMWDDHFHNDPYPFEGPERKPPVPKDYGFQEK